MSSAPNLQRHAESFGVLALDRSRRMALVCTFGVGLALSVLLLLERAPRSIRMVSPALMEMRVLPAPLPAQVMNSQPEKAVLPHALISEKAEFHAPVLVKKIQKAAPKHKPRRIRAVQKQAPAPAAPPIQTSARETSTSQAPGQTEGRGQAAPHMERSGEIAPSAHSNGQSQNLDLRVLMQAIETHKHYPRQARRSSAQGTVLLLVRIGKDGRVLDCAIQQSSGSSVLDGAARELGEKLQGMDRGLRGAFQVVVPVRYSLL